ncbi:NAD(P)-binding domain-containing protein [Frankia sp. CNm7]|uniref:NAD(P)-binding domain-containing protein n=1 Tax=Frankia nepalensis TaxID=1836974 RepID=A0A937RT16_9ACTN|nr:NAD(P)-binding domain-containing protein [Frankia nepalensis]MBL7501190.1 NAD(P)-binding domain-containing protein [Frankia nepalensis]MBL7514205.1 NAD(P)-binding domain-containing protein [Frankia nepalensis]MBL7523070.1 NAD(P)-binding domain-containing protein [Frankia nepalensis]MBL7631406.1 NAD(P)-binding domain-containing protein [Frankia nepalensis]
METIDTVVIGAGQAGLAVSRCLASAGREHVVLDRGTAGQRWRDRWRAQRLLTPNWMNRLPFWAYQGDDPDGFLPVGEFADHLARYAASFAAPLLTRTTVESVTVAAGRGPATAARTSGAHAGRGPTARFLVRTDQESLQARNVVIAAGACDQPAVPSAPARALARDLRQLHAAAYRGVDTLPDGGVLVVGASSSGLQIAEDARRSGREVTIAVGTHKRLPRSYRGMDIWWWLDQLGSLDRRVEDLPERPGGRREPSSQLVAGRDLDLGLLHDTGVRLVGRLLAADRHRLVLADDLSATTATADATMRRVLARIELHLRHGGPGGIAAELLDPEPFRAVAPPPAPTSLDLRAAGIRTVVWATGYRYDYPWLKIPWVRDDAGGIRQHGGITPWPGLYVVGLPFLTRRGSHLIGGVRHDAAAITRHLCLGQVPWPRQGGRVDQVTRP